MKIAVMGLGIIGTRMASNWVKAGHEVTGWNRTMANAEKTGLRLAKSPAEAASTSDIIVTILGDPASVDSVICGSGGIATVSLSGKLVINSTTVDPECNIRAEAAVKKAGGSFVEAPFTGSKEGAEKGKLIFFTAGDKADCEKALPVLSQTGGKVFYFGKTGAASDVKLALNVMLANTMQSISEGLSYAKAAGIDENEFIEAFRINAGWCGLAEMKLPKLIKHDYSTHFSLKHMYKDVCLALKRADKLGLKMPLVRATEQIYSRAMEKGFGEEDFSVVYGNL